jgi:hypothetical protein
MEDSAPIVSAVLFIIILVALGLMWVFGVFG